MGLELKTAPSVEPISITEAKAHLRVDIDADNTLIDSLIKAARQYTEAYLQKCLITQTWYQYYDFNFPNKIELLKNPAQSITEITYTDGAGATQILDASVYNFDANRKPATVLLAYSQAWPSPRTDHNVVRVEFIAGYGDAGSDVPQPIRQAMLLLIGHLYENREEATPLKMIKVPMGYEALLSPYRLVRW